MGLWSLLAGTTPVGCPGNGSARLRQKRYVSSNIRVAPEFFGASWAIEPCYQGSGDVAGAVLMPLIERSGAYVFARRLTLCCLMGRVSEAGNAMATN